MKHYSLFMGSFNLINSIWMGSNLVRFHLSVLESFGIMFLSSTLLYLALSSFKESGIFKND